MREEQHRILALLGQLPARLTADEAASVLNCQPHDIPVLVSAKLLKPLGTPAANSTKFFATVDLLEQRKDRNWLVRVTNTLQEHWQRKNARQHCRLKNLDGSSIGPAENSLDAARDLSQTE